VPALGLAGWGGRADKPGKAASNREGGVPSNQAVDYYEILQISPNAEPETVHRVFRLLAQRYHPDNAETGNEAQFRALTDAYRVLSDPEQRARYDIVHTGLRQERWRLVASASEADNNFDSERSIRLTVLEVLYTRRRLELDSPGLSPLDLEKLTGRAREHLEFTLWFLVQKKYLTRSDGSLLTITVEGVEYLENNHTVNAQRRLGPGPVQKTVTRVAS
jgi:curved DNA-binding protein CbpA